jgi:hypothetical protein
MSARRSTGKSRALGVATAVGAVGGIVGIFGSGTAVADPVSLTLKYTCTFPRINAQSLSVKINPDVPASVGVGESARTFVIDAVATVGAATTQGLGLVGAKTLEGTVDAKASVVAPQGTIDLTVPIGMTKTAVPVSGSFDVRATGTAPALTFSQPGQAKITVGDLTLHLAPKDANGNLTGLGAFDSSCKEDAGQSNVLASFSIAGTGATSTGTTSTGTTTTGTTTTGTTGAITAGTKGSTTAGTAGVTTGGTAGTTGSRGAATDGTTGATTTGTSGSTGTTDATGATTYGSTGTSGSTGGSGSTTTDGGDDNTSGSQLIGTRVGDPTGGDSLADTGSRDVEDLILLSVGTLIAGAVTFRFGSRLAHRGADDDH